MSSVYQGPGQNSQFPQGPNYPVDPMAAGPAPAPVAKEKNTIGLVALVCAVIGFIFACVPGALIIGWILLPIAFILSLVGLFARGKKKGMALAALILSIVGTLVGFIVFFTVIGNAVDESFNAEPTIAPADPANQLSDQPASDADKNNDAAGGAGDSRENPLPLGTAISGSDWTATVNSVDLDATEAVIAANPFNDAPGEGQKYILADVTLTYTGDDPQGSTPWASIDYVTIDGTTISSTDNIAVAPNQLDTLTTLYGGGSVSGNIPLLVPADTADQGVLAVEPDMFTKKKFVAVK
ncbi:hypothetical protein CGLAU_09015 [Corynebacterium glaucum]|uniref:DUF4352 domain-containing protein n=2 Tax=Corynebacterium glaucum TaxID=187491 RepID=A0A1Q2HY14_9CORY|nr:hypothetical protein CGLAU_09015 [Corynebacterium glaucum]